LSEPKISVVIPVRNEAAKIEQCLEAVFSQSLKPYEVIIVDGHSTDGTVERAQKFPAKVLYEDYHTRGGACQVGIENAASEYIAFTDADCIPDKDWLANLIKEFDDSIVGVGGGTINVTRSFWEKSIDLAMNTFLGGANTVQARFFKTPRFVRSISGCNSMYRKTAILEVGGFNVKITGEDAELNRRLLKMGRLKYTPKAVILHDHGRGFTDFAKRMYIYGKQRKECMVWDLQVIPALAMPPVVIILLILSLIFTRWIFLIPVFMYIAILLAQGVKFAIDHKQYKYVVSIPIVYATEHILYVAGFWRKLMWPRTKVPT
jgi:cellulose synthase/poly-beta-1,6-N-acetylglucosamine synthase-like glycosyltransferase